jgi:hypothetical protein
MLDKAQCSEHAAAAGESNRRHDALSVRRLVSEKEARLLTGLLTLVGAIHSL